VKTFEVRYRIDGEYKVAYVCLYDERRVRNHVIRDLAGHDVKVLKVTRLPDDTFPRVASITRIEENLYTAGIEFAGMGAIGGPIPIQIKVEHFKMRGHDAMNVCAVKRSVEGVLDSPGQRTSLYKLVGRFHTGEHVSFPVSLRAL
jgi:hypothetical protein